MGAAGPSVERCDLFSCWTLTIPPVRMLGREIIRNIDSLSLELESRREMQTSGRKVYGEYPYTLSNYMIVGYSKGKISGREITVGRNK